VDSDVVAALVSAARRKVKVQVELPQVNDEKLVQDASRAYYPDPIKAGVEVYEYQGRMAHEKVAVIDDDWVTFGSSNLDARSLVDNDELNVIVLDRRLAATVDSALFEPDLKQCRRITSFSPSLVDEAGRLIGGLLLAPAPAQ
jgi:cardiolipin synthase